MPNKAQAELTVRINDNLNTQLGAVAIDAEVWISNPVTGDFETLPTGYDIDPSKFFDPENGWRPLLTELRDVELVGIDDRGGERYHVRGIAPAAQVREITVGLVRDQDVPIDLWVHPDTSLVTAAELTTVIDGADSHWVLALDNYGDVVHDQATGERDQLTWPSTRTARIPSTAPTGPVRVGPHRPRSWRSSGSACSSRQTTSRSSPRCCARSSATSGWCCPTGSTTQRGSSTPT